MSEEFISALSQKVKRVVSERQGNYTLLLTEIQGIRVIFCLKETTLELYYVKVILEEDISSLSCREAEYAPTGLYAFSKDPRSLAELAYKKSLFIINRKKQIT